MSEFKNKVALVTGGGRDIGRECSIKLAAKGASVCINYLNNREEAERTLKVIKDAGGNSILAKGDMTNPQDVEKVVADCRKEFGDEIHILVNNAGGLVARKTMSEMDLDFWNTVITLNLTSVFLVTKEVLKYMPDGSTIVNFSSQAARDGAVASAGTVTAFGYGSGSPVEDLILASFMPVIN